MKHNPTLMFYNSYTPLLLRDVARTFKGGSPADTNNYDRFDAPIALNTREV